MIENTTTTKTISHIIDYASDQYWEIEYTYRNDKLMSIALRFNRKDGLSTNTLTLASWSVDGHIVHILAQLVYYFKTKEFEKMFPNITFTDPEEKEE